jgi:hypothetical protein
MDSLPSTGIDRGRCWVKAMSESHAKCLAIGYILFKSKPGDWAHSQESRFRPASATVWMTLKKSLSPLGPYQSTEHQSQLCQTLGNAAQFTASNIRVPQPWHLWLWLGTHSNAYRITGNRNGRNDLGHLGGLGRQSLNSSWLCWQIFHFFSPSFTCWQLTWIVIKFCINQIVTQVRWSTGSIGD